MFSPPGFFQGRRGGKMSAPGRHRCNQDSHRQNANKCLSQMQRIVFIGKIRYSSHMKPAASFALVLVTAPNLKTARTLAKAALEAKLIACANLIPKVESHYRWQGKIESAPEVLMILKTAKTCLAALEKLISAKHPYDTPEF